MDGLPVFSLLEYALPDCTLLGFDAVFNATTNFIIDAMGAGRSFRRRARASPGGGLRRSGPRQRRGRLGRGEQSGRARQRRHGRRHHAGGRGTRAPDGCPARTDLAGARADGRRLRLVTSVWRDSSPGAAQGRGGFARRPRPRPSARRGTRHRAPARGPHRRVPRRGPAHRPHGRRVRQREARPRPADRLRRLRGPPAPVPDELRRGRPRRRLRHPLRRRGARGGPRPARRPSWLRALLLSLVILAAGTALGAAGYHWERTYLVQAPEMLRTEDGWRILGRQSRHVSGLGLSGPRLLWQNGAVDRVRRPR